MYVFIVSFFLQLKKASVKDGVSLHDGTELKMKEEKS